MKNTATFILSVTSMIAFVHGYQKPTTDQLSTICATLEPGHGSGKQNTNPPFMISFGSTTTYSPGNPVTITLRSCMKYTFKGFFMQARYAAVGSDQSQYLGSFIADNTVTHCNGHAISHNEDSDKVFKTVTWNPPNTNTTGHVNFMVTFVMEEHEYWSYITSQPLLDSRLNTTGTLNPPTMLLANCTAASTASYMAYNQATVFTFFGVIQAVLYLW
ncbi:putative ferric-chelate reductase 1 [Physella acuta]|uniref:putative ferric-chelate reductase 1 n=1 Tax=Physella acuta TaxID=109671 RepID=UPI0027DAB5C5|nr:putative ferric-chelate reductase 1 [Physella acuta]XP_059150210.1 putative ferric-chelate reductase 1 [Physella acuta]